MTETKTEPVKNGAPEGTAAPQDPRREAVKWEKPSMFTKISFAAPSFASSYMMAPMSIELKIFYTDIMLVPAGLLALVTAISRAFDALTDPFMAYVTDNTRTKWGRRKIYLPIGIPLSALCYWMMFGIPRGITETMSIAVWIGFAFGLMG